MKIYIGSAIQGFTDAQWTAFYKQLTVLKNELRARGHEILEYVTNHDRSHDVSDKEIFAWDHEQCMSCDAMLALAFQPSTGMGMEISVCLYGRKGGVPVFATALKGTSVSKMVTGCGHPKFAFSYFNDFSEVPDLFETHVKKHSN